ncbi:peroxiredoxin [Mucilaginibacter gracilis]|uniref:Peroxiredoxin n=1 Tax=Mucilaginibacter gracilis TaxID=423350 RepID=A0A495J5L8_9SPHI|nr:TlpA disulfide reductase family protein [Mucilaginibacter gracilis]RKR83922.1 peroxiredoxin [Mucilaginibacter gracilis]
MRSKINLLLIVFCAVTIASCKHDDYFILSGEVKNPRSIQKVYLLKMDTLNNATKEVLIDSAALSDQSKFSFKQSTSYPNMYKLKVGGTIFDLIAKNGDDIDFKTDATDTTNMYEIGGSMDSEHIKDFNKLSNFYGKITEQIMTDYNAKLKAIGAPSDSLFKISEASYQKNEKDYAAAAIKFMNDNKSSLTGFYAASSLNPIVYETDLIAYADAVRDKFSGNPAVEQFVKHMDDVKPVSIGHKAPQFTLMDANYKPVKVSDFLGKYLIIDFWASWCLPCRKENPNVVKLYNKYKNKGLNILGVSLDNERADWQKAIEADHLTWTQVSEFQKFDGPVEKAYRIEAIPSNFIIDPKGNIVAKNIMGAELEDFLNKAFSK